MIREVFEIPSPREIRDSIFSGEILWIRQQPDLIKFCDRVQKICIDHLNDSDPSSTLDRLNYDDWAKLIFKYQTIAQLDSQCINLFKQFLISLDYPQNKTYADRFIFRVVPPESSNPNPTHGSVTVHRDTWGAGIYQQINWWGPIFPYPEKTGIKFYIDYFNQPIKNTTTDWRYNRYATAKEKQIEHYRPTDYQAVPVPLEEPGGQVLQPTLEPGDILCFSAAHLHGSSQNLSSRCRLSFETRTVSLVDIQSGKKAPNQDNVSTSRMTRLFRNLADGSALMPNHFKQVVAPK
ncbi:MAG: hypothetical protein ACI845_002207 [Gammaproteobacteria bacterium]